MKSLIIKPKELSVASDISFKCKQRNKKIVDISIISYENEFTKVIKRKLMFDALNFNKKYKLESNKFLSSFWLIIKKICYETKIMWQTECCISNWHKVMIRDTKNNRKKVISLNLPYDSKINHEPIFLSWWFYFQYCSKNRLILLISDFFAINTKSQYKNLNFNWNNIQSEILKLIINNYDKNVSVQLFKNLINQIKKAINDNENIISKIYSFRNKNLGHFQDIPNDKDEMSKSIEIIYDSHNFEKEPNINELLKLSFLIKNIFLSCSSIFDNTNQENLICIPNLFYLEQKNLNILKNVFINCNFFDECHYDYITQFNRNKKTTTLIG